MAATVTPIPLPAIPAAPDFAKLAELFVLDLGFSPEDASWLIPRAAPQARAALAEAMAAVMSGRIPEAASR